MIRSRKTSSENTKRLVLSQVMDMRGELTVLCTQDVSNNQIASLPRHELLSMTGLRSLLVTGNPFTQARPQLSLPNTQHCYTCQLTNQRQESAVPSNALDSSGSSLLRYLREQSALADFSTQAVSTLNLIVLGNERTRPHHYAHH